MIIYCHCPDDDQAAADARAWIKRHRLTPDDARLVKRDGCILVIDKGSAFAKLNQKEAT